MTAMAVLLVCLAAVAPAAEPEVHYLHQGVMPPGAIGRLQLARGGPLQGFYQPVEIKAPNGASVSMAVEGRFHTPVGTPLRAGLLIGQVYRIRVTNIPLAPGVEIFPTIEVIDRLYTPAEQAGRFSIPVELTAEDLRLAAEGKFVTRVIYLEDPLSPVPVQQPKSGQQWFDAAPGQDPLAVADAVGRPVAILRLGGRLPVDGQTPDAQFLFGCPPFQPLPAAASGGEPNDDPNADSPARADRSRLVSVHGEASPVRSLPTPPAPTRQAWSTDRDEVRR